MELGLEKCGKIAFKTGKLVHSQNLVIDINREIQELELGKLTITLRLRKVNACNMKNWKKEMGIKQEIKNCTEIWTEHQEKKNTDRFTRTG